MKTRLSILLVLVTVLITLRPTGVPNVTAQEPQPTPTPTLVKPEDPTVTPSDTLQFHIPPSPVFTSQESIQSLSSSRVLETLYVLADGSQVQSSFDLQHDIYYTIRVTGMFIWGGCDPLACPYGGPDYIRWGDAEFLTDGHWHSYAFSDPYWSNFIYLEVNGIDQYFGPYREDHMYIISGYGNDKPVTFRIRDCSYCYPDNAASLRVEIIEGTSGGAFALGVKPFLQQSVLAGDWGEDRYGYVANLDLCGTQGSPRVCEEGSYLTSWAMILDYWGFQYSFHTSPRELNEWLCKHKGYKGLYAIPRKVAEYAREMTDRPYSVKGYRQPPNDQELHNLLMQDTPVILQVRGGGHFVVAVGEKVSEGTRTWYINDPGGCGLNIFSTPLTTLDDRYNGQYARMDWGGELAGPDQLASTTLMLASPAELLVIDPQGRRTGKDPRTGDTYSEIPDATYGVEELSDDSTQGGPAAPPLKVFDLPAPPAGSYIIQVIGTGSGTYVLDILNYDEIGDPAEATTSGQAEAGSVDAYRMDYSSAPGSEVVVTSIKLVALDVKPESCPNPFNTKGKGAVSVAVAGTEEFDVTQVDPVSVRLEGVAPLRWSLEDSAIPYEPYVGKQDAYDCREYYPDEYGVFDGILDLTLKFDRQEVVAAIGEVSGGDVRVLKLTGNLKEEFGGTPIVGEDVLIFLK